MSQGSATAADPLPGRDVRYPEQEPFVIDRPKPQAFLDYCLQVKPPGAYADRRHFEAEAMHPWLGNLMILDELADADDFRYRLYGTHIAESSGFDMTGKRLSELESPAGRFFHEMYREALDRKTLVYGRHSKVHARHTIDWLRVICPVARGTRRQIVACNYPVRRDHPPKR